MSCLFPDYFGLLLFLVLYYYVACSQMFCLSMKFHTAFSRSTCAVNSSPLDAIKCNKSWIFLLRFLQMLYTKCLLEPCGENYLFLPSHRDFLLHFHSSEPSYIETCVHRQGQKLQVSSCISKSITKVIAVFGKADCKLRVYQAHQLNHASGWW